MSRFEEDFWDRVIGPEASPNPEDIWTERFLKRVLQEMDIYRLSEDERYMIEEAITQFMEAMESSLWTVGPEQLKEAMAIAIIRSFEGLLSGRFSAIRFTGNLRPQPRYYTRSEIPDSWREGL